MFLDFKIAIAKYDIRPAHSRGGPSYFCIKKKVKELQLFPNFEQESFYAFQRINYTLAFP